MSDWTSALAVPADLAEASASLSRRTRAAAAGGSYDLAVVCAVGAAAVGAALAGVAQLTTSDSTTAAAAAVRDHRQESLACAADVLGVPFAWGLSSAVHGAPRLLLENGTASTAARVAGRAVADGLFIPVDECALDESLTAARALACAGGAAYFALQLVERARLALLSSEALAAAGCIFDAECDAGWRLPLAALKLVLYAAATADSETHAYFLGAQLELAWALLDRPPPPPPPPPRRGWPGALRRWWRARTGRSGFGKEEI